MKKEINDWLRRFETEETVPAAIVAFYIGLFETEHGYGLSLSGAEHYDETDDDWACDTDFEPKNRYLQVDSEKGWEDFLHAVVTVVSDYLAAADDASGFKGRKVAVGFDDGDLVRIK